MSETKLYAVALLVQKTTDAPRGYTTSTSQTLSVREAHSEEEAIGEAVLWAINEGKQGFGVKEVLCQEIDPDYFGRQGST